MATQFINSATAIGDVDGTKLSFNSNTVTAELFDNDTLTLNKSQNISIVVQGSTITYTVVITNTGSVTLNAVEFEDSIPTGLTFEAESFTVNGNSETPIITGQDLKFTIPTVESGDTTIVFNVTVD